MRNPWETSFWAAVALSWLGTALAAGATAVKSDPPILADVFAGRIVLRIEIEIPPGGMRALSSEWNGRHRPSALATIKEGGRTYSNVAVHLKGGAGSYRQIEDNPGLTLEFDKHHPGQSFHGLKKLSLNNSVQDSTFLNDKICRELFNTAGSPTPRAGFTTVRLNGRDLGIHVLTEGFNKQFLRHYFTNVHGNLYQTHGNQEITERLDVNSGDNPTNDSGLKALAQAVHEQDPAIRWRRLGETLDLDRFLSFMAMEVMLCHWDGYCMNQNNYRVFHDLGANKIVFIAHGLDQMFGTGTMLLGGQQSTADCPIYPNWRGAVADAAMSTPEGRRLYLARLGYLYTNLFRAQQLLKRVDGLSAVVRTGMTDSDLANFQREVENLKAHIVQRDSSLAQQLATAPKPQLANSSTPIDLAGSKAEQAKRERDDSATMAEDQDRKSLERVGFAKMKFTRVWGLAFQLFARENGGKMPEHFKQAANYLPQAQAQYGTWPGSIDDFEIVLHGSLSDIQTPARVIILREKKPFNLQPSGKAWRTYLFADGHCEVHCALDGNFEPWEKEHTALAVNPTP